MMFVLPVWCFNGYENKRQVKMLTYDSMNFYVSINRLNLNRNTVKAQTLFLFDTILLSFQTVKTRRNLYNFNLNFTVLF